MGFNSVFKGLKTFKKLCRNVALGKRYRPYVDIKRESQMKTLKVR